MIRERDEPPLNFLSLTPRSPSTLKGERFAACTTAKQLHIVSVGKVHNNLTGASASLSVHAPGFRTTTPTVQQQVSVG